MRSTKLLKDFTFLFIFFPRQPIAERVMGGEESEDPAAAEAGSDIDLLEDEDEAIGDRIMEVGAYRKPHNSLQLLLCTHATRRIPLWSIM